MGCSNYQPYQEEKHITMQASKKHSFLRRSPLAYVVVPLAFVLVSTALVFIVGHTVLAPYQALLGWFFSTTEVAQPRDLLDNAAKFSPENGTISVTLHCEQGRPVVAVTDQGCGMDAETCRHIFEQFYQGDTSHRTQGNGLGLAMAQKIAALHGGAVTVDSRPGSGSCFTVVLQ